jgi:hypothetical protein
MQAFFRFLGCYCKPQANDGVATGVGLVRDIERQPNGEARAIAQFAVDRHLTATERQ